MLAPSLPQPKSDISDFGRLRCRTRVNPSSDGRVADPGLEPGEAGWGSPQRVIDERQHALQIPIDLVVPETQYPEALVAKILIALRVAPRMHIEIMLTAIDLYDETLLETDEVDDIAVARGLAAEVESPFSPEAQMNPQLDLLRGHSFAKAARDFVSHVPPTRPPPAQGRGRPPSPLRGEGLESVAPAQLNLGRMIQAQTVKITVSRCESRPAQPGSGIAVCTTRPRARASTTPRARNASKVSICTCVRAFIASAAGASGPTRPSINAPRSAAAASAVSWSGRCPPASARRINCSNSPAS